MAQEFLWNLQNGDLDGVKTCVQKDKKIVNIEINGRYPMHYAADYGHLDVMEYLLQNGAKIDEGDKYGITPLLSAIYEGHKDCVAHLLKAGANKNLKTPDGQRYFDIAESVEIKNLLK